MKTCVIIPTYNEAKAIGDLIQQIRQQDFEIVVIDDGSADNTAGIARDCGAIVLRNETNQGKGASLVKGFNYALAQDFDAVITMDGDGQHLPADIFYFIRLATYSENCIFIGNRMLRAKSMPLVRFTTNKFMSWLISKFSGQKIPDTQCGFRLIKREVLKKIDLKTSKYETESEVIVRAARLGFKIESVPIKTVYNSEKSQINPIVDSFRFIRFMIGELWTTRS